MKLRILVLTLISLLIISCESGIENPHGPSKPEPLKTSMTLEVEAGIDISDINCILDNPWGNYVTIEIYVNSIPIYSFELGKCFTSTGSKYEPFTYDLEINKQYEIKFRFKEENYPDDAQIENIAFSFDVKIRPVDTSFFIYRGGTKFPEANFSTGYFSAWTVGEFKSVLGGGDFKIAK